MSILIRGMELDGRPHKAFLTEREGKPILVVETQYSYADNEVKVYPVEELQKGLLVKDAELPKTCFFCPFREKINPDDIECTALRKIFEETLSLMTKRRHEDCPLIQISPAEEGAGMSILINDMEMPKMPESFTQSEKVPYVDVRVFADGTAVTSKGERPYYTKYSAIPVPPHGRLIDADAFLAKLKKDPLFPLVEKYGMSGVIEAQPTIIPAEEAQE